MAETTNARSARFLAMPTVVGYCGVSHPLRGICVFVYSLRWHLCLCLFSTVAFVSLSILYGALDSVHFIAFCFHENSSSPPNSILGNHIPVCNIDRKFHHGHFTLVLGAKLGSSNVTCALSTIPHIVSVWEFWSCPCAQCVQATRDAETSGWDIVIECQLFLALLYLGFCLTLNF